MRRDLPRRVHVSGRWYWHVRAAGVKRIWEKLSLVADGMPALHAALSRFLSVDECPDGMPMLIADWLRDVSARHAPHTQGDERRRCAVIAARFAEFQARQVTAPDVAEFLNSYTDKPRTHNAYRSLVRELMRYAILRGYRTDNPVEGVIRTMRTPARSRYITDSEMRRIKVASLRGDDRKRTRTGVMMCCLIEMAYLTAGDVGVLIRMLERRDSQRRAGYVPRHPREGPDRQGGFGRNAGRPRNGHALNREANERLRTADEAGINRSDTMRAMEELVTLRIACERMKEFLLGECHCPCCGRDEVCADDCTLEHDDPNAAEHMTGARYALYGDSE
jgi:hypothetical protein